MVGRNDRVLIFWSISVIAAGCSDRVVMQDDPPSPCVTDADCPMPLTCGTTGLCEDPTAACDGLDCGGASRGECIPGDPDRCECNEGYTNAVTPRLCCPIDGPDEVCGAVQAEPGHAGGVCQYPESTCVVDGVICDPNTGVCIDPDNPCLGVYCGGIDRGTCSVADERPVCTCNEGFANDKFALYCCPADGSDLNCVG